MLIEPFGDYPVLGGSIPKTFSLAARNVALIAQCPKGIKKGSAAARFPP
jgi:hypothetical protein